MHRRCIYSLRAYSSPYHLQTRVSKVMGKSRQCSLGQQVKREALANSPKENMIASSVTKIHEKPFRFISAFTALYTLERRCWTS